MIMMAWFRLSAVGGNAGATRAGEVQFAFVLKLARSCTGDASHGILVPSAMDVHRDTPTT